MSAEAVQAFLEAVKADAGLQEKLQAVAEAENADDAIVALGAEAGFDFTAEEWLEEQLQGVDGGAYLFWGDVSTLEGAGGAGGNGGAGGSVL